MNDPNSKTDPVSSAEWMQKTGALVGILTLIFFMALVFISIMGFEVPTTSRFIVTVVLALGSGLSVHFLGGSAAVSGYIPLPLAKEHPVRFAATGALAVLVIILALGYLLYVRGEEPLAPAKSLFEILEDEGQPKARRLGALQDLRDGHGTQDFRGRNLSGLDLPKRNWVSLDLTEARLRRTNLEQAVLRGARLVRADLTGTRCDFADFRESELNGAIMVDAECPGAFFSEVMLRAGRYSGANFENADFDNAWMQVADFRGANFTRARLRYASLAESDITDAVFVNSDLIGTSLRGTIGIRSARFGGAIYNSETVFTDGFDPQKAGMVRQD